MAAPRWKTAIENALAKSDKSTVIQISTVSTGGAARPHVRSHIFRSFITPKSLPSLPVLLSSTDARTPKVAQILANPLVEVAWWIEGTQEQFRIFGKASLVPSPDFKPEADGDVVQTAGESFYDKCMKSGVLSTTDAVQGDHVKIGLNFAYDSLSKEPGFDWEAKRVEVFKTMSAHMKASWCRPTPGTKLPGGYDDAKKWPERVEEPKSSDPDVLHAQNIVKRLTLTHNHLSPRHSHLSEIDYEKKFKDWTTALRNFALVLIEPLEVDYVELGVVPNRRTHFWIGDVEGEKEGRWREEAVAP
ncbi:FMN-binding split barrel [Pleurotus pulmonarius]